MAGSLKERIGKDGKSVSPVGSFMVRSLASYDQITTRIIFAEDAKTEGSFMVNLRRLLLPVLISTTDPVRIVRYYL
jgi:hypothetical protein